jgi:dolichyl-phosphate beta-glucosyltransferase
LNQDYEIVLVNDGSTDGSDEICKQLSRENSQVRRISYGHNMGKGYAVKQGMLRAEGRYRIMTDVDLAVPMEFVGNCLAKLRDGEKVVIGSRHLAGAEIKIPENPLRQFLGELYRKMIRPILGLKITDVTCGLKGFENRACIDIFSRSKINRWGYDAEIIYISQCLDYSILEIPVAWYHSFDSKVKITRDSLETFLEMLKILRNARNGSYS